MVVSFYKMLTLLLNTRIINHIMLHVTQTANATRFCVVTFKCDKIIPPDFSYLHGGFEVRINKFQGPLRFAEY